MNIHNFIMNKTNGEEVKLIDFKGNVLIIVNTASKCGFTKQYSGLQALYDLYKDKGLEILDFPCNQFRKQAPQTDVELESFCQIHFGVKFKTFAKVFVKGKNISPLYRYLTINSPIEMNRTGNIILSFFRKIFYGNRIKGNFTKFIISKNGDILYRFGPSFKPENMKMFIDAAIK